MASGEDVVLRSQLVALSDAATFAFSPLLVPVHWSPAMTLFLLYSQWHLLGYQCSQSQVAVEAMHLEGEILPHRPLH